MYINGPNTLVSENRPQDVLPERLQASSHPDRIELKPCAVFVGAWLAGDGPQSGPNCLTDWH